MPLERRTGLMESSNVSTPSLVPPNPVPGCEPDCVFFPVIIFGHQYTAESIDLVTQTARVRSANYQERFMFAEAMRTQMLPSGPDCFSDTVSKAVGMHLRGGGTTLQVLRIAHYSGTEFAPQTPQDFYQPPVHQPSTPLQPPRLSYPQPPTDTPVMPDPFYDSFQQTQGQPSASMAGAGAPPPPPPPRTTSQLPRSGRARGRMAEQMNEAIFEGFRTGVFVLPEGASAQDIRSAIGRVQSGEIAAHWVSPRTVSSVIEQMEDHLGATAMPMEPAVDQIEAQLMNALHYYLQGDPFVPPAGATPRMIQHFVEGLMDGSISLDPSIRRRDMREACKCMIDTAMAMARGEQVVFPPPLPMQPSSPLPSPQLPQQPNPWAPAPAPFLPLVDEGMAFPYHPEPGEPPAGHDLPTVPMVPTVPIPVPALPVAPSGDINTQLAMSLATFAQGGPLELPPGFSNEQLVAFLGSMRSDPALQSILTQLGLSQAQVDEIFAATQQLTEQLLGGPSPQGPAIQPPVNDQSSRLSSSSSSSSSSDSEGEYDVTAPFPQRESIAKALYAGAGTFFDRPAGVSTADLERFLSELIDCQPSTPMEGLLAIELPDWKDSKTQYVELLDEAIWQSEREADGHGSQHVEDFDDLLSTSSDQELNLEEVEPEPEPHVEIAPQPSPRPSPVQPTQSPQPSQPQAPVPPRVAIAQALASGRGQRFEIPEGVSGEQLREFIGDLNQAGDDSSIEAFISRWLPYWASYQTTYTELLEKAINDLNQSRPEQAGPAQGTDSPTLPSQQDLARRAIADALTAGGGRGFLIPEDVTREDIQRFFGELRTSKADSAVAAVLPRWTDFKYSYLDLLSLALKEPAQASGSTPHPSQDQDHNQQLEEGAVGGTDVSGPTDTAGAPSKVKPDKKPSAKDGAARLKRAVNDAIRSAKAPHGENFIFEVPNGVTVEQAKYRRRRLIENTPDGAWKTTIHQILKVLQDFIAENESLPQPKPTKRFPFFGKKQEGEKPLTPLERAIERAFYYHEPFTIPAGTTREQAQQQHRKLTQGTSRAVFLDDLEAVLQALLTFIYADRDSQLSPPNDGVGTSTVAGTGDDLGSVSRAPSPPASPSPSRAPSRSPSRAASPVPSQPGAVEQQLETAPADPQPVPSPSHSPAPSRRSSIASVTSALSVASHTSVGGGASAPAPSTEGAVGGVDEKGKGKAKKGDGVGFINRLLGRGHGAGLHALLVAIRDAFENHDDLTVPEGTTARDIREALRRMGQKGYRLPRGTSLDEFRKMILDLQDRLPEFNTPKAQLKQAVLRHIHHGERLYIPEGASKKDVEYRIRRLKASGGTQIPGVSKEKLKEAGRALNRLLREHLKEQAREDMPPSFIPPSPSRGSSSRSVASQGSAGSGGTHRRPLRSPPPPPVDRPAYVPEEIVGSVRRGGGETPPPGDITAAISTLDLAVGGEEDDRSDASSHRSHTGSQRSSDRSSLKGTDL